MQVCQWLFSNKLTNSFIVGVPKRRGYRYRLPERDARQNFFSHNFGLLLNPVKKNHPRTDELETEYALLREILLARQRSGLTQAEVAEKMGTKPPAVTRLETALSDCRHSPTIATLKKYAQAVGCKLEVHLVPTKAA
jgi:ribosome-binding protein aMBF1 (putative translation factor)